MATVADFISKEFPLNCEKVSASCTAEPGDKLGNDTTLQSVKSGFSGC